MELTSANMEENYSKQSDEFVNFWVPVIRKLREKTQFASLQMLPSMSECVEIMDNALKTWEFKTSTELVKGLLAAHKKGNKEELTWFQTNCTPVYAYMAHYKILQSYVEALEENDKENWWDHYYKHMCELAEEK